MHVISHRSANAPLAAVRTRINAERAPRKAVSNSVSSIDEAACEHILQSSTRFTNTRLTGTHGLLMETYPLAEFHLCLGRWQPQKACSA